MVSYRPEKRRRCWLCLLPSVHVLKLSYDNRNTLTGFDQCRRAQKPGTARCSSTLLKIYKLSLFWSFQLCSIISYSIRHVVRYVSIMSQTKDGYDYPTIHLPFSFSGLIGLSTRIYQTAHDGALAFLVVLSPSHESEESARESENFATSSKPLSLHGGGRRSESSRANQWINQDAVSLCTDRELQIF